MNIYEVGIASSVCKVEAPSAEVAALYYGMVLSRGMPLGAAIYSENGQEWEGDSWWMAYQFKSHLTKEEQIALKARIEPLMDQFKHCRVVPEGETELPADTLIDQHNV